jgi:hypothetical protein
MVYFSTKLTTPFSARIPKIGRSLSIVAETGQIPNRRNSLLSSETGRFERFGEPEPHFVWRGSDAPPGRNGMVERGMRLRRRGEQRGRYADEGDAEKHTMMHL